MRTRMRSRHHLSVQTSFSDLDSDFTGDLIECAFLEADDFAAGDCGFAEEEDAGAADEAADADAAPALLSAIGS